MPNRMLRDWTLSDKMNSISVHSERFFIRLIMKVDDHGCFHADTRILKANLYPLLLDSIREADLTRWMAECQKADLIVLYESAGKNYLQIKDFRQRLDKSNSKYPIPILENQYVSNKQRSVNKFPPELEVEVEVESPNGHGGKPPILPIIYSNVAKTKKDIVEFIRKERPKETEPYVDLWNLFAKEKGVPQIKTLNDTRKRKLSVRIRETEFDFLGILKKASDSIFLRESSFFSFDWIIENERNYLKVLEGNYDNKIDKNINAQQKQPHI